jgi:ribulose-phosphate 3-epimerase
MNYLSPSILSADFCNLGRDIACIENAGAKMLHIDIMDGMFVPSISFGMPVFKCIREATKLFTDVHMMVEQPQRYVEEIIKIGADMVTIHLEACDCVEETLAKIRSLGAKAGLAINPKTPVSDILPFMDKIDMALVMTVEPGFGGQLYIEECTDKIRQLRAVIDEKYPEVRLEIDGGVTHDNLMENIEAGADVIVAGSSVFKGDIEENIRLFLEKMKN